MVLVCAYFRYMQVEFSALILSLDCHLDYT